MGMAMSTAVTETHVGDLVGRRPGGQTSSLPLS